MPSVLVTLGRLPKGLDIIRSFDALGWRVIVADPYRNHLARVSRAVSKTYQVSAPSVDPLAFKSNLIEIVKNERVDLVVPVSEDILYVSALIQELPSHAQILSMPSDLIRHVHDKYEFINLAREISLSVPDTALISQSQAEVIAARGNYVVKPRHSCAGFGVGFFTRNMPLPAVAGGIVQEAISGQELSTCALAHDGRIVGQAIYRGTLQSGTVSVGFERVDNSAVDEWVKRFVATTRWTGFISFDFLINSEGTPFAIECNPRTTSGLHFFINRDIAKAILDPTHGLLLRRQTRLIQFWSAMQHFADHFGEINEMSRALRHIFTSRDVTFSWRDPLPLILMPWAAKEITSVAKRNRTPFGIAATRDFTFPPHGGTK